MGLTLKRDLGIFHVAGSEERITVFCQIQNNCDTDSARARLFVKAAKMKIIICLTSNLSLFTRPC